MLLQVLKTIPVTVLPTPLANKSLKHQKCRTELDREVPLWKERCYRLTTGSKVWTEQIHCLDTKPTWDSQVSCRTHSTNWLVYFDLKCSNTTAFNVSLVLLVPYPSLLCHSPTPTPDNTGQACIRNVAWCSLSKKAVVLMARKSSPKSYVNILSSLKLNNCRIKM